MAPAQITVLRDQYIEIEMKIPRQEVFPITTTELGIRISDLNDNRLFEYTVPRSELNYSHSKNILFTMPRFNQTVYLEAIYGSCGNQTQIIKEEILPSDALNDARIIFERDSRYELLTAAIETFSINLLED